MTRALCVYTLLDPSSPLSLPLPLTFSPLFYTLRPKSQPSNI